MATITRRGQYQWRACVRRHGLVVSRTFSTRLAAESWAHDAETAIAQGTLSGRTEAESTTLAEALARYALDITPTRRSADRERGEIRRMQARPIANKALSEIRGKDMATYIRSRQADGVGSNAIRLELALHSHVYTVARSAWGMESLVNPVPLAKVARPRLPLGCTRRLLDAAKTYGGEIGRMIAWAIETAMRRGEITAMRWEHWDRKARVLLIPETKTGTPRRVPLSTRVLQILEGLSRRLDGKVWGLRPDSISQAFERVCTAADIEGLTFHDLRHEATSRLFEKGLNPLEVATITGHKTLQMLKRYTHLRAEDLVGRLG